MEKSGTCGGDHLVQLMMRRASAHGQRGKRRMTTQTLVMPIDVEGTVVRGSRARICGKTTEKITD